ncbi:MAG: hypothetical protein AAGF97_16715 [Planctomycetota bacterium]
MLRLVSSSLILALLASFAHAQTSSVDIDTEWGDDVTGLVASGSLDLPAIESVKSITIDISHTWQGDIAFDVVSPSGVTTIIAFEGGSADLGVVGDGTLADVAPYTFAPPTMASGVWAALGGGSSIPSGFPSGAGAGTWTFNITDDASGDGGAVGTISIDYNVVPEPVFGIGALLIGLCGLLRFRR